MNTDNITINQNGGVTKVSHGAPSADTPQVTHESSRVSQGTVRHTLGEATTGHSAARYTVGQDTPTGSVMATLRNVNGAQTIELEPGNPASRTHLRMALETGLIEAVGNGQYRDKGMQDNASQGLPQDAPQDSPEDAPVDPGKGVFSAQDDEDWQASIDPLSQSAYDSTSASVTVAVMAGADNLDRAAANLAEQAGMEPELAKNYVQTGYEMYEAVVAKAVATVGVTDKQDFYKFLRDTKPRELQHAIQSLTMGRDVALFKELASEYNRHSSPEAKALKSRMR